MPLGNRFGRLVAPWTSIRVYVTADAGSASAFLDTNTRPTDVAAHIVPVSAVVRSIAATLPPPRLPSPGAVRSPALPAPPGPPSASKSPQPTFVPAVVNSGQFASRTSWLPPLSFVRQTCWKPVKIVPPTFGSAISGQ